MRLTLRLLGADVLDVELRPTAPPEPPPPPRPCRFTAERTEAAERPTFEASGGGDFGFGPLPVIDEIITT